MRHIWVWKIDFPKHCVFFPQVRVFLPRGFARVVDWQIGWKMLCVVRSARTINWGSIRGTWSRRRGVGHGKPMLPLRGSGGHETCGGGSEETFSAHLRKGTCETGFVREVRKKGVPGDLRRTAGNGGLRNGSVTGDYKLAQRSEVCEGIPAKMDLRTGICDRRSVGRDLRKMVCRRKLGKQRSAKGEL